MRDQDLFAGLKGNGLSIMSQGWGQKNAPNVKPSWEQRNTRRKRLRCAKEAPMLKAHLSQEFSLEMYIVLMIFMMVFGTALWSIWAFFKSVWNVLWEESHE